MPARLKVFFDGGCRPGPGTMEIAVVIAGRVTILPDVGQGTSGDAEWLALIHALTLAQALGAAGFVLLGDAADVIAKANGDLKCRRAETHHVERYRACAPLGPPRLRYVRRSQNLAGIALAARHPR